MAAKAAFPPASYQLRVSGDWVVETVDIELAAHHAVIETSLLLCGFRFIPAGFRSEYPAGFKLECMAGFVGTRTY